MLGGSFFSALIISMNETRHRGRKAEIRERLAIIARFFVDTHILPPDAIAVQ